MFLILSMDVYQYLLLSCTAFLILWFLIHTIWLYCKWAGSPFRSEDLRKKTHHVFIIFMVWTVAFIFLIIMSTLGSKFFYFDVDNENLGESLLVFLTYVICIVIPTLVTLDSKFIKILKLDIKPNHMSPRALHLEGNK